MKLMKGMTPLLTYENLLITASAHIIIPLTPREMVANVYLLHILVCMMVQVKYCLVITLGCGLNNYSFK